MKYLAVALAALLACVSAESSRNHPVVKVIALIDDLKAKAIEEGKTEALAYEKFQYWCKNSVKTLSKAVSDEKEKISSLTDEIAAKEKEEESLTEDISDLTDQLSELEASAMAAKKTRDEENSLYTQASADLEGTITAVDAAIKEMKGAKSKGPSLVEAETELSDRQLELLQKPSMRQVLALAEARSQSGPQRKMLATLLQQPGKAGHVRKYAFKSGNVIELLKNLKLSFEDELTQATKEETNALNAYELTKKARDNTIKAAKLSKKEKKLILSDVQQALIDRKADLKSTQDDLTADSGTLQQTDKECSMRAQEWEERSEVRAQELEAMDVAKKILAKAANVRSEAPSNPVPPPSPLDAPASFLQVVDPKEKALNLLREAARKTHSKALERFAERLSLRKNDAFDVVNNSIEKMIFKLMDEQKQEDEHKAWCDKEVSKTDASMDDKSDKLEELDGKIGEKKAKYQELLGQIKEANEMIADVTSFVEEATEIRATGKEENKLALKDAQDSQAALANAIAVLETFYKESGMVQGDFLQVRGAAPVELPKDPSTWDSGYTGVADPAAQPGGIVAVLKKVAADFAKMEADTRAQEATDQQAYDQEMSECKIEKARRSKEVEMKTAESDRLNDKISSLEKSRKSVQKEFDLTEQYMKDLKPACIDGGSSYEDRKKARTAETDALREAQGILKDAFKEKSLVQSGSKFLEARRHVA